MRRGRKEFFPINVLEKEPFKEPPGIYKDVVESEGSQVSPLLFETRGIVGVLAIKYNAMIHGLARFDPVVDGVLLDADGESALDETVLLRRGEDIDEGFIRSFWTLCFFLWLAQQILNVFE